jgi:uncharacterized membrane protein
MADYPAPVTTTATESRQPPVNATLLVYALFAIAALVGIVGHGMLVGAPLLTLVGIVAVIIAYITRGDARGTWAQSHFSWLSRTFWWSLLWNCIGWLVLFTLGLVLIGIPIAWLIWLATTIWVVYRVVRGYVHFHKSEPVPSV